MRRRSRRGLSEGSVKGGRKCPRRTMFETMLHEWDLTCICRLVVYFAIGQSMYYREMRSRFPPAPELSLHLVTLEPQPRESSHSTSRPLLDLCAMHRKTRESPVCRDRADRNLPVSHPLEGHYLTNIRVALGRQGPYHTISEAPF